MQSGLQHLASCVEVALVWTQHTARLNVPAWPMDGLGNGVPIDQEVEQSLQNRARNSAAIVWARSPSPSPSPSSSYSQTLTAVEETRCGLCEHTLAPIRDSCGDSRAHVGCVVMSFVRTEAACEMRAPVRAAATPCGLQSREAGRSAHGQLAFSCQIRSTPRLRKAETSASPRVHVLSSNCISTHIS